MECFEFGCGMLYVGGFCLIFYVLQELLFLYLAIYILTFLLKMAGGTMLVEQLVVALRYKPECRGFDSRLWHWNFFIDIILPAAL